MHRPQETNQTLAPHAPLPRYYAEESNRRSFVREIFDTAAVDYDRIESVMALGSGSWYRQQALLRAGLSAGTKMLDVAVGTGLVARQAMGIVGNTGCVIGVDPSFGMLGQAKRGLNLGAVQAVGEQLPFAEDSFDFISMGYALRHLSDLRIAFAEFLRALKPGGTLCVMEISRPTGRMAGAALRCYMRGIVPLLSRITGQSRHSPRLWEYYADTIEACVPPQSVLDAMRGVGYVEAKRYVEWAVFSEYTAKKPLHGNRMQLTSDCEGAADAQHALNLTPLCRHL